MSFKTTVTLVTAAVTGQDKYGKDVLSKTESASPEWVLWPTGLGSEAVQGQDITTDNLTALAPAGVDITSVDRVKWNGKTYEVQGTPYPWQSPITGTAPGVQVELKAVSG